MIAKNLIWVSFVAFVLALTARPAFVPSACFQFAGGRGSCGTRIGTPRRAGDPSYCWHNTLQQGEKEQ